MRYLLTVQTNGRPDYLRRALDAAQAFLTPPPAEVLIYDDGEATPEDVLRFGGVPTRVLSSPDRVGMCEAYCRLWETAADLDYDWIFHHEDDQLLLRPVRVDWLATVLNDQPHLAQMALVRCPWGAEVPHGGYIPAAPGWYVRCSAPTTASMRPMEWIETTRNWATSPALMRASLYRSLPCPAEPGCETTIGPRLLERDPDTRFGLWGWGEPWYAHIGMDRAQGSYGY